MTQIEHGRKKDINEILQKDFRRLRMISYGKSDVNNKDSL